MSCPRPSGRSPIGAHLTTAPRTAIRRIALARLVSLTGGEAAYIALMVAIYDATGSAAWMSATLLLTWGATGLLTPFGGALGDRFDRRTVMIASDLAAGVAIACLALTSTPAIMLAIALLSAAAQAPFYSASTAAVPNLVTADEIAWANGTVSVGRNAGQVLGPVMGGVLVGVTDPSVVFLLNAACFAASAGLVGSVHGRFSDRVTADADEHRGIRAGFRFLLRDPVLRMITLAWIVLLAGVGPVLVAELPLARSFGVGSTGYGLLAASWGAGAIAGSFLGQRLGSRRERAVMILSAGGMAAGFAIIGVAGWFVIVLLGMAFAGVAEGAGSVAEQGIVQRRTPDAVRSRVIAASEAALLVAFAASFGFAAPVIHIAGVQGTYVIAAAASVAAAAILVPAMRGLAAAEIGGDVDARSASPRAPGHAEADRPVVPT
jgi:MFS family permease